jgi:hypothetical protein
MNAVKFFFLILWEDRRYFSITPPPSKFIMDIIAFAELHNEGIRSNLKRAFDFRGVRRVFAASHDEQSSFHFRNNPSNLRRFWCTPVFVFVLYKKNHDMRRKREWENGREWEMRREQGRERERERKRERKGEREREKGRKREKKGEKGREKGEKKGEKGREREVPKATSRSITTQFNPLIHSLRDVQFLSDPRECFEQ